MTFTCKACELNIPQGDEYRFWETIVDHYKSEHPDVVAQARPPMRTFEDANDYLRSRRW